MLIDGAALLPEVNAGAVCAPLEHQFAIGVPLRHQVGQAFPIALVVNRDARVIAAGRAVAARDRPRISAPPGVQKIACRAVHRALSIVHCRPKPPYDRLPHGKARAHPFSVAAAPPPLNPSLTAATRRIAQLRPAWILLRWHSPRSPASVQFFKPSCADLFRASTPFLSGASRPYAARPARGCTSRSIAVPCSASASDKSYPVCKLSQNSGVVPR